MKEPAAITSAYTPDLKEVRTWIETMIAGLRFADLIVAIVGLIVRMRDINSELTVRLAKTRSRQPKSETLARVERQLLLVFAASDAAEEKKNEGPAANPEKKQKESRKGSHLGRNKLPAHLARVPEKNDVPPSLRMCPACGTQMKTAGHSMCEILDIRPAELYVRQRYDERVSCPHDNCIVSAPTPPAIVEGGKLGTTLIIESLSDKYLECQPVERQCLRFYRTGVDIAPQTLGRSVAAAIDLLRPIAEQIKERTRSPGLLATDATGIPVLDRDAPDGIRNGTMWNWINGNWVTFYYSPRGDSDSVRRFLGDDLIRSVQCDGTNITTFIERAGGKRPGCWSHGRRRLVEAARGGDQIAMEGLEKIAGLFRIEKQSAMAGDTFAERLVRRKEHSSPIMDDLKQWLDDKRAIIVPKTPLGAALGYLHRQWNRLALFLENGAVAITNNRVERELRKLVLGRRNWLFVWGDLGGERTASILSIIGTCVAHGVNPRAYLHLVTNLLLNKWPQSRLRDLLPDRMAQRHPELVVQPDQQSLPDVAELPRLSPPR